MTNAKTFGLLSINLSTLYFQISNTEDVPSLVQSQESSISITTQNWN